MQYCLQTCCYLGSSISKNLFQGFHGPPRSEGFVPPSLTEPVKSDTSITSDTSGTRDTSNTSETPVLAASSPDQIFSNRPTQISSSPSTHVLSSPSPLNITPLLQQEDADLFTQFIKKAISSYKTSPPNADKKCDLGNESLIPPSNFCRNLIMKRNKGVKRRGRKGRNM